GEPPPAPKEIESARSETQLAGLIVPAPRDAQHPHARRWNRHLRAQPLEESRRALRGSAKAHRAPTRPDAALSPKGGLPAHARRHPGLGRRRRFRHGLPCQARRPTGERKQEPALRLRRASVLAATRPPPPT